MYVDMQAVANAESKLSVCQPPLNGVLADSATMDTADARPWWIVAIRRDVDRLQLWLNGEKDADAAILGAPDDSFTAPMMLGGDDRTSVGFSGDVAEFLLYETDLSDRDVLDITASLSTKSNSAFELPPLPPATATGRGGAGRGVLYLGVLRLSHAAVDAPQRLPVLLRCHPLPYSRSSLCGDGIGGGWGGDVTT